MRFLRCGLFPDLKDQPELDAFFGRTFLAALLNLPLSIGFPLFSHIFHQGAFADSKPWSIREFIPTYGCVMALLWLLFARHWTKGETERLGRIPERSVEQAYRFAELEAQRGGIRLVLWGTIAGAWLAMIAGWFVLGYL